MSANNKPIGAPQTPGSPTVAHSRNRNKSKSASFNDRDGSADKDGDSHSDEGKDGAEEEVEEEEGLASNNPSPPANAAARKMSIDLIDAVTLNDDFLSTSTATSSMAVDTGRGAALAVRLIQNLRNEKNERVRLQAKVAQSRSRPASMFELHNSEVPPSAPSPTLSVASARFRTQHAPNIGAASTAFLQPLPRVAHDAMGGSVGNLAGDRSGGRSGNGAGASVSSGYERHSSEGSSPSLTRTVLLGRGGFGERQRSDATSSTNSSPSSARSNVAELSSLAPGARRHTSALKNDPAKELSLPDLLLGQEPTDQLAAARRNLKPVGERPLSNGDMKWERSSPKLEVCTYSPDCVCPDCLRSREGASAYPLH